MPSRILMPLVLLLAAGPLAAAQAPQWRLTVSPSGSIGVQRAGRDFGTLEPGLFEATWRGASLAPARPGTAAENGVLRGQIRAPGGTVVDVETRAERRGAGLHLVYRLTPEKDVALNSLHVTFSIPAGALAGGSWVADGERGAFPTQLDRVGMRSAPTRSLDLVGRGGARLDLQFAQPTPVLLQDDRQWGPSFSVRIGPQMDGSTPWPGGKTQVLDFTLNASGGMAVDFDGPVTIEPGAEWVPLDEQLDIEPGSALDFSKLVPWHTPAGKYGRVVAGPHGTLAFADRPNEPQRFYGVNLCFTAQYVTHEQADRLAERFYRLGYNAVRVHHYESTLVDRSQGTSTRLNPEMLDRLDYLLAALKKRGIYVTTDLFVSRPVFAAEVWDGAQGDVGMDEYKMAVPVNERAFENYKAFSRALLGHVNPYTGMRWADDPTLAWLSLINEPNPGNFLGLLKGNLLADYRRAWTTWYDAHLGSGAPAQQIREIPKQDDQSAEWRQFGVFLADNQAGFHKRAEQFLRGELGCKALLTNLNAWTNPVQIEAVRPAFDYVDDHFYVDHPEFIERPWQLPSKCPNTSPVAAGAPGGRGLAFVRLLDKPFTCSEYNYSGPGRFRGVGGILTGALGSVQDWSVIWKFAYSHSRDNLFTPSPAGYFDVATDPLSQAADRASLCLFRRGDMRPAPHSVAVALTGADVFRDPKSVRGIIPGWTGLAWVTRVGSLVPKDPAQSAADMVLPVGWNTPASAYGPKALGVDPYAPDAGQRILAAYREKGWLKADNRTDLAAERYQSETGELTVDAPADTLTLDTARTAGGYAPAGQKVNTAAVTVSVQDTDATVWVSSVDGAPIGQSRRLLITHLTDLQNTGTRYGDRARRVLLGWGGMPHLVRQGHATVTIRLQHPEKARVWGLETNGRRAAPVAARVEGGALVVPVAVDAGGKARMLYEVEVRE